MPYLVLVCWVIPPGLVALGKTLRLLFPRQSWMTMTADTNRVTVTTSETTTIAIMTPKPIDVSFSPRSLTVVSVSSVIVLSLSESFLVVSISPSPLPDCAVQSTSAGRHSTSSRGVFMHRESLSSSPLHSGIPWTSSITVDSNACLILPVCETSGSASLRMIFA